MFTIINLNRFKLHKKLIMTLGCCFILSSFSAKNNSNCDTIKIASWNIQMTPNIFSPFIEIARKKQKKRCPKIIQYLNASEFDIVILQEVFDKKISKEIQKGLSTRYPYILSPIKEGFSIKLSSGVMILSKHPFKLVDHVIFGVSKKIDKAAQKGCSLIKVNINNKSILVGGTHLDSKNELSKKTQYKILKEKIIDPNINDSIPMFLAGDFNTDFSDTTYHEMISILGLTNSSLEDERPYTFDEFNSWNNKGYKAWIDFILYQKTKKIKISDYYILRPKMQLDKNTIDLADHYQIILEAIIY